MIENSSDLNFGTGGGLTKMVIALTKENLRLPFSINILTVLP